MSDHGNRPTRKRIVIEAPSRRASGHGRSYGSQAKPRSSESLVAISVIAAAALATFIALFLTSRPYDPMTSTAPPQEAVPQAPPVISPSPKPSSSVSPQPKSTADASPQPSSDSANAGSSDDATILAQIEKTFAADPALSKLDVSPLVEGARVTLFGSVRSADLKTRVEKAVSAIKGVVAVDNQLVISEPTP